MTTHKKERKVRHRPSVVNDHQAYLHNLMAELDRAAISLRLGESLKLASPEEVQALREAVAQLQGDVQEMLEILCARP